MDESSVEYRNFIAVQEFSKETRKFLRVNDAKVDGLMKQVSTLEGTVLMLQAQVGGLLAQVHGSGPTETQENRIRGKIV